MIEYATASLTGIQIQIDTESAPRTLRFGSDSWARNNVSYERAISFENTFMPPSLYFAELERSWSEERFNLPSFIDSSSDTYTGISFHRDNGMPFYNDSLVDERELPIAQHFVPRSVFGISGYNAPSASSYMDVCDRGIAHIPSIGKKIRRGARRIALLDRGTNIIRNKQHSCKLPAHLSATISNRPIINKKAFKRYVESFIE